MKKKLKHFSLRIDEGLLRQFEYVARYDERSMNWLLLQLIRRAVAEFEDTHGRIPDVDDEKC